MLNSKKRRAWFAGILVIIIAVGAYALFIHFHEKATPMQSSQQSPSPQPPITFFPPPATAQQPILVKDQLFYTDSSGLFSYDVTTGKTWQIAAVNASTSVFNGQRIGDDAIGFEVGQAYASGMSSVYMLDIASDTLTKEADVGGDAGWYIDNLDFIAPGEFVYTEASTTASMIDNYDRVFLFRNSTTTQIGYISNPGEYGSTLSSSPDGKHLFFANQTYNTAAGSWTPLGGTCKGPESAWLNNNVVILKGESDGNYGGICYHNITSGAEGSIGPAEGFSVTGNKILYMDLSTTLPRLFQIWQYDYATHAAQVIIPNARLWSYYSYDMNGFPGVVYQSVITSGTCFTLDCLGGVGSASGSLMMFDPATGSSTPLGFGSQENIMDLF